LKAGHDSKPSGAWAVRALRPVLSDLVGARQVNAVNLINKLGGLRTADKKIRLSRIKQGKTEKTGRV
jgi:hypothetical protein